MKRPSLKKIIKKYKNAKEVICTQENVSIDISKVIREPHFVCGSFWVDIDESIYDGGSVSLWDGENGYAEILTYKEKTFSITESQIKQLEETETIYGKDSLLHRFFPEAFESEVKFETGWYVHKESGYEKWIKFLDIENKKQYGHGMSCWNEDSDFEHMLDYIKRNCRQATGQEVFEALKNEAVKRGFVNSVYYKSVSTFTKGNTVLLKKDLFYSSNRNMLTDGCDGAVFEDGVWAEIIPTITLAEAEQQLKKKIIV